MKAKRLLLLLMIGFMTCIHVLVAQSKEEKKELKAKQVKELVEAKDFKITVDRVLPMKGRSRSLTSEYTLTIKNDSVFSHLPYFGQAYSLPYGGGVGMIFKAPVSEYKQSYNKKGTAQIYFRTRSSDDTHQFNVQVFPNASVTIMVTSINRQGITYYGTLDLTEETKE
ncbi:MAG: DUF4251 domain-containing protein [Parabacteroides sp.]|nr:DUF4251 domain-containing protein [Parabacteroides sp.]